MQQERQNYGLGSFVKKVTGKVTKPFTKVAKKIVPKEIAGIMRVAAPFLPPGYREAAYLLGTAKQTGRLSPVDLALVAAPQIGKINLGDQTISQRLGGLKIPFTKGKTLKEALVGKPYQYEIAEGPTQTLQVGIDGTAGYYKNVLPEGGTSGIFGKGGEMYQIGKGDVGIFDTKAGQALFGKETKTGYKPSYTKIGSFGLGVYDYLKNASTPQEAGEMLVEQTGDPTDYDRGVALFSQIPEGAFDIPQQYRLANGGMPRSNFAMGGEPLPEDPTKPINPFQPKPTGPVLPNKMADIPKDLSLEDAIKTFRMLFERDPKDMEELLEFYKNRSLSEADSEEGIMMAKNGGFMRKNFALGTRPTDQESGLGGLPIEADMRYTGGFMPYGAVEKADDVPARLSKNEFVFTADAVRAAGGGSVEKGAQKMYNTMKQLEAQSKGMA
jgi:hypothetical protein